MKNENLFFLKSLYVLKKQIIKKPTVKYFIINFKN